MAALTDRDVRERVVNLDTLLQRVESLPDPIARGVATEAVQLLLEVYGEGLARLVACLARASDRPVSDLVAGDEVLSHLLLVHGLHPLTLEARVGAAIASLRPELRSRDADVRLVQVDADAARLSLETRGHAEAAHSLVRAIEAAVRAAAPDVATIDVDTATTTFIPLSAVTRRGSAEVRQGSAADEP